jgi:leucyl aminopeptidase
MAKASRKKVATTARKSGVTVGKPAKSSQAAKTAKLSNIHTLFGMPLKSWSGKLRRAKGAELRAGKRGFVFAVNLQGESTSKSSIKSVAAKKLKLLLGSGHLNKWQLEQCLSSDSELSHFQGAQGPLWIVRPSPAKTEASSSLEKSYYAKLRDLTGSIVPQLASYSLDRLILEFNGFSTADERGAIVGLEMAAYSYAENRDNPRKPRKKLPTLLLKEAKESNQGLTDRIIKGAGDLGLSVNIARHLTNLPGGTLNPKTYAEGIKTLFSESKTTTVTVWEGEKLREERMGLLLAVGGGAAEGPRFVHIRYRPKTPSLGMPPLAIVGKGITFDSGGLDIKPSSAMRWMKKDMGGSAAAIAVAKWAELTDLAVPLDVYVSLAENAVSATAFRPGDVITARNGITVEIQNTDAEGRLVLADALDVAASAEEKPHAIINLATLTGAIKVGLGSDIAGLFCNHDDLAKGLFYSGLATGDLMWRMPLFQPYKSMLKSTFADHQNSADGFAGAITAALFLELFVRDLPWAHLDIYAWKDAASGACSESGANGQSVQALAEFLDVFADQGSAQ